MFECIYLPRDEIKTVYAVDPRCDAFLIFIDGEFKWRSMERFKPIEKPSVDDECAHNCAECWKTKLVNSLGEANV